VALSHYSLLEYRSRHRASSRSASVELEPEIHSARVIARHRLPFAYAKPTRDRRHVHVVVVRAA
jgi:hypothetical protein